MFFNLNMDDKKEVWKTIRHSCCTLPRILPNKNMYDLMVCGSAQDVIDLQICLENYLCRPVRVRSREEAGADWEKGVPFYRGIDKPSAILKKKRQNIHRILQGLNPRVFGSVARGEDGRDSDLDIIIDASNMSYIQLYDLQHALENELGVPVDLFSFDELKSHIRQEVSSEMRML